MHAPADLAFPLPTQLPPPRLAPERLLRQALVALARRDGLDVRRLGRLATDLEASADALEGDYDEAAEARLLRVVAAVLRA